MNLEKLQIYTPYLYYFCTIHNLKSILNLGILSRNTAINDNLIQKNTDWSSSVVQGYRSESNIEMSDGENKNIHDLVNVFFNPYNVTIYKAQENLVNDLNLNYQMNSVVLAISVQKLQSSEKFKHFAFTDGNVGTRDNHHVKYNNLDDIHKLDWKTINKPWKEFDNYYDSKFSNYKSKKSSEFFINEPLESSTIESILCTSEELKELLEMITDIPVLISKTLQLYKKK